MKKFIALGFGCLLAQGALAQDAEEKVLPSIPADCADQIADNGLYCSTNSIDGNEVTVTFAAVVSKEAFPAVENILSRYTSFARWPEFAAASPQKVIEFSKNGSAAGGETTESEVGTVYTHAYDYSLKIQGIPLLKQAVKGTTTNTILTAAYPGAEGSLEFAAGAGAKGLKSQVGSIHALVCDADALEVCDESKWLLIYQTTVQPEVSFAMGIAANTVTAGIEDLLVGMLDESIVDPVVEETVEAPATR